jgi:hypothetical protein
MQAQRNRQAEVAAGTIHSQNVEAFMMIWTVFASQDSKSCLVIDF